MQIRGRETLRSKDVCLILSEDRPLDPQDAWTPYKSYFICEPEPRPLLGYRSVGFCDIRFAYNRNLYYAGHIGYHVKEPFRGHEYALKASRLLFAQARRHQMPYLLITCNPDNDPSRHTIERLCSEYGGRLIALENVPPDHDLYQRGDRQKLIYRFDLA